MKNKFILGLASITLLLVLSGCNKAPQTEIDTARIALTELQVSGADLYLPEEFTIVNDSMNGILLKIEAKKSKWFARYDDEKEQLMNITTMANTVMQNTETRKNEIKNEIVKSLSGIQSLLEENQNLLSEAPKGKEGTAVLVAIKDELSMLNASVADIMKMMESGDYINAQSKVSAVNDKALAINMEMKEAISKYTKRQR